jgi:hypothetical protein
MPAEAAIDARIFQERRRRPGQMRSVAFLKYAVPIGLTTPLDLTKFIRRRNGAAIRTIRRARNRRQGACSGRRRIGVAADQNMLDTSRWNAARIDGNVDAIIDFAADFAEDPMLQLAHYSVP